MDTFVEAPSGRRRRRHSADFKASVIQACRQPGVSIAAVALANGLNANMLRKWVFESGEPSLPKSQQSVCVASVVADSKTPGFFPVTLPAPATPTSIRVEVQRAGTVISVSWPVAAAAQCAAWLRELLR